MKIIHSSLSFVTSLQHSTGWALWLVKTAKFIGRLCFAEILLCFRLWFIWTGHFPPAWSRRSKILRWAGKLSTCENWPEYLSEYLSIWFFIVSCMTQNPGWDIGVWYDDKVVPSAWNWTCRVEKFVSSGGFWKRRCFTVAWCYSFKICRVYRFSEIEAGLDSGMWLYFNFSFSQIVANSES